MKSAVDLIAARELELYAENTSVIYHRRTMPTVENLRRKASKGQYNREKAVKAWEYVAEAAAKMYAQEFGSSSDWFRMFNKSTRHATAEALERVYYEEYIEEADKK